MKEIKKIVSDEAGAEDDKENKPLYSEEEKLEMNEFLKKALAPGKMITVHHLHNAKLIFEWLMIFSRIKLTMKKEKLIVIKTVSTAKVAGFHLKMWCDGILADIGKVEVGKGKTDLIYNGISLFKAKIVLSLESGTLLTDQQKRDLNNEVARLRNFLQLLQFCRDRESKGHNFPLNMKEVSFSSYFANYIYSSMSFRLLRR